MKSLAALLTARCSGKRDAFVSSSSDTLGSLGRAQGPQHPARPLRGKRRRHRPDSAEEQRGRRESRAGRDGRRPPGREPASSAPPRGQAGRWRRGTEVPAALVCSKNGCGSEDSSGRAETTASTARTTADIRRGRGRREEALRVPGDGAQCV